MYFVVRLFAALVVVFLGILLRYTGCSCHPSGHQERCGIEPGTAVVLLPMSYPISISNSIIGPPHRGDVGQLEPA